MPASLSSVEAAWTMLRWGQDGLALLSSAEDFSTDQTIAVVMLLRGPFVTPQLLQTSSAASLTASSASTLAHSSGNAMLTLTGAHFLPGVAVTWNGSYRTATIVDCNACQRGDPCERSGQCRDGICGGDKSWSPRIERPADYDSVAGSGTDCLVQLRSSARRRDSAVK
jgi:hypothetical protein